VQFAHPRPDVVALIIQLVDRAVPRCDGQLCDRQFLIGRVRQRERHTRAVVRVVVTAVDRRRVAGIVETRQFELAVCGRRRGTRPVTVGYHECRRVVVARSIVAGRDQPRGPAGRITTDAGRGAVFSFAGRVVIKRQLDRREVAVRVTDRPVHVELGVAVVRFDLSHREAIDRRRAVGIRVIGVLAVGPGRHRVGPGPVEGVILVALDRERTRIDVGIEGVPSAIRVAFRSGRSSRRAVERRVVDSDLVVGLRGAHRADVLVEQELRVFHLDVLVPARVGHAAGVTIVFDDDRTVFDQPAVGRDSAAGVTPEAAGVVFVSLDDAVAFEIALDVDVDGCVMDFDAARDADATDVVVHEEAVLDDDPASLPGDIAGVVREPLQDGVDQPNGTVVAPADPQADAGVAATVAAEVAVVELAIIVHADDRIAVERHRVEAVGVLLDRERPVTLVVEAVNVGFRRGSDLDARCGPARRVEGQILQQRVFRVLDVEDVVFLAVAPALGDFKDRVGLTPDAPVALVRDRGSRRPFERSRRELQQLPALDIADDSGHLVAVGHVHLNRRHARRIDQLRISDPTAGRGVPEKAGDRCHARALEELASAQSSIGGPALLTVVGCPGTGSVRKGWLTALVVVCFTNHTGRRQ